VLLAALSPAGVKVGVDLRHRGGVVDGGGWVVGIVVVVARPNRRRRSRCWFVNLKFSTCVRWPRICRCLGARDEPRPTGAISTSMRDESEVKRVRAGGRERETR
jgi:hypothetical protein